MSESDHVKLGASLAGIQRANNLNGAPCLNHLPPRGMGATAGP